jgi:hypothetical protein
MCCTGVINAQNRLDDVADRLDAAARASGDVYPMCTGASVVDLARKRESARAH